MAVRTLTPSNARPRMIFCRTAAGGYRPPELILSVKRGRALVRRAHSTTAAQHSASYGPRGARWVDLKHVRGSMIVREVPGSAW